MRNILLALLVTLSTQVGAGEKKYSEKECKGISEVIDFLLSLTPQMWKDLEKNSDDKEQALKISWALDLAANYTIIYQAFCSSKD